MKGGFGGFGGFSSAGGIGGRCAEAAGGPSAGGRREGEKMGRSRVGANEARGMAHKGLADWLEAAEGAEL